MKKITKFSAKVHHNTYPNAEGHGGNSVAFFLKAGTRLNYGLDFFNKTSSGVRI